MEFAVLRRMEKLVKHQPGGTPRPGIVPPWFDHEFDIGKEPVEAVRYERVAQGRQQEIEEFRPLAADDDQGWIEYVDDG